MTPAQYSHINELLRDYSAMNAALEKEEADIKILQLEAASELLPGHARLKTMLTKLEVEIRKLADENYESLFPEEDKRNHKTPFGTIQYRKSSALRLTQPDIVPLIKGACAVERERAGKAGFGQDAVRFHESELLRTFESPNLEALERLDDETLATMGITREKTDNFSIKPFEMKADKPAKSTKEKAAA